MMASWTMKGRVGLRALALKVISTAVHAWMPPSSVTRDLRAAMVRGCRVSVEPPRHVDVKILLPGICSESMLDWSKAEESVSTWRNSRIVCTLLQWFGMNVSSMSAMGEVLRLLVA